MSRGTRHSRRSPAAKARAVFVVFLALAIGAMLGHVAGPSTGAAVAQEVSYQPVATTLDGRLRMPAVWSGSYRREPGSNVATLAISARITGTWSGSGIVEISLPNGWRAASGHEAATMTGFAAPGDSFGLHVPLVGVLHPGATKLRLIAPRANGQSGQWWFAVDGVQVPFKFTAGSPGHGTTIDITGQVRLAG